MRNFPFFKQILLAVILSSAISFSAKAQYSLGVTANYGIATDDLAKAANNAFGGTLQLRYHYDDYIKMGIDVGYISFGNKNTDSKVSPLIDGNKLNIIPVTAVFEVHFNNKKLHPFMALDLGWAHANLNLITNSKNFGIVAPQFGLDYAVSDQFFLRASAKDNILVYNRLNSGSDLMSYVGINIGGYYKF